MTIIKVPSVFMIKLPSGGWLNLASVRRVQFDKNDSIVIVYYDSNHDREIFRDYDALAIIEALHETNYIDKSNLSSPAPTQP